MSTSRHCQFFKATDDQWYLELGDFEYAYDRADCTIYGPFKSEEDAHKELHNHSNPGAYSIDDSGKRPVPPNVTQPLEQRNRFRGRFYR